ncbi:hypothetical protein ACIODS_11935 [Micromonospora chalcea]|uniref:hypothetical protein n=1 Tax=Micromonospora chalcea TaxID=1874 RepID=UPI003810952B
MTAPARQRPADVAKLVRAQLAAGQHPTVAVDGSRGWWVLDGNTDRATVYRDGHTVQVEWTSVQADGEPA